jgi:hypothetical protein
METMPRSKSASSEAPKKSRKAGAVKPSYDEIALRAYRIYLKRGSTPGDPMQDWLQAERELTEAAGSEKAGRKTRKIVSIAA